MTQHWLILKTDASKEFAVADVLADLGHEVWVPTRVNVRRVSFTSASGKVLRRREAIERPLLPSVLFVGQTLLEDDLPVLRRLRGVLRHLQNVWTDCFEMPRLVPESQLSTFRERVEAVNAAERARIMKAQMGKQKKKRVLKIDPKLADELKAMLFGQQQQEAA